MAGAQLLIEMGSCKLFAQDGFKLQSSLISPSQVVRITGMSHWCLAQKYYRLKEASYITFCVAKEWEISIDSYLIV
jgi:hypothetical protein